MLRDQLGEAGLKLDAAFGLRMPANYAVLYNIPSEESQQKTLQRADRRLERIRDKLDRRVRKIEAASAPARAATAAMYPGYQRARRTAPFHTNDTCIGCAACANRCPSRAIEMKDGHPTWVKERCSFCMSCVRCGAIEYGSKLTGKARYKHPMLRKATDHGGHGDTASKEGHDSHDASPAAAGGHDHGGAPAAAGWHDHGAAPAAAGGHDHGAAPAAAGGHEHGGDDSCCCDDSAGGGHDHGAAPTAASGHDHGAAPAEASGHDHGGGEASCCGDKAQGGHQH